MKSFIPDLDHQSKTPLYVQLYKSFKEAILKGNISTSEKLPSIRDLSKALNLSKTTVASAYDQLLVEGYIYSKPQSGFYINNISSAFGDNISNPFDISTESEVLSIEDVKPYTDSSSFDFFKWKKCSNKVLTEYRDTLLLEAMPQGETFLRNELSKYVYQSRGVKCTPEQIVIGAGTQQIMYLVCNILEYTGMNHAAFEDPGYYSARKIFLDRGFLVSPISIDSAGMSIKELKSSPCSVAYVSPSHQFPLGSVMPIGRRYQLLEWAKDNRIIIEDDYDSELRYYGRPIPALQGLDKQERVIYLGSFSSTLLPSIKISYIILPNKMLKHYKRFMHHYHQTCSKIEQLTLALYMKEGFYQKHIKKLRKLNATKAAYFKECLQKEMGDTCKILNLDSGIHLLIEVNTKKTPEKLCEEASQVRVHTVSLTNYMIRKLHTTHPVLLLYYTQIPLEDIPEAVKNLKHRWLLDLTG